MAAQVGVAGTTKIGEWCIFGGQAGISGHSSIGDRTTVGPQCGTIGSLKSGVTVLGSPAIDAKEYIRISAYSKKLPTMDKTIKQLKKEIEELKAELNKK
jgi:UDP-3-O-[3-hydroxymyristoyl] glucosamine N-acyltransferase